MTPPPIDPADDAEVLVVGGGPAGLASAIELARRDRRVVVVDRGIAAVEPAVLLSPRSVSAVRRLGLELNGDFSERFHEVDRIRLSSFTTGGSVSVPWPETRDLTGPALVAPRIEFIEALRRLAVDVGVTLMAGCDAVAPIVERGFVRGAVVRDHVSRTRDVRSTYTVVADGPNSQFGRLLGTFRQPSWPVAVAQAGDFESPFGSAPEVEVVVGVTDRIDTPIAGYGWMLPAGAQRVTIGVMLMSTSPSFQVTNPLHLLDRFVGGQLERWQLGPIAGDVTVGGRIPMGASVGPLAGPTYLIVGDAAGAANPLTGMGIDTALETGIMAGDVIGEAFEEDSASALQQYPKLIDDRFGSSYKSGRLASRLLGQPAIARRVYGAISSRRSTADGALRVATQHLRSGRGGGAEFVDRVARTISTFAPDA